MNKLATPRLPLLLAILFVGWINGPAHATAQASTTGPIEAVKEGAIEVGHAVRDTAVDIGHGARTAATEFGHGAAKAGRAVRDKAVELGHDAKESARRVGKALKPASEPGHKAPVVTPTPTPVGAVTAPLTTT